MKLTRALRREDVLFLVLLTALGFWARSALFGMVSQDYMYFLGPWYDTLRDEGFSALGRQFGDYSPLYYYLLAILAKLSPDSLLCIKLLSCAADVVLALYAMRIAWAVSQSRTRACLAYALVFLLPQIVFNSAAWAQCDAMYAAALAACVYYFTQGKDAAGMLAYSVAFAFKLQAILLGPFLLILFVLRRIRVRAFFLVPAVYVLTCVPAWLCGRSWKSLLSTYFQQTQTYGSVSMNAPSLYLLFSPYDTKPVIRAGVLLCAGVVLCAAYLALKNPVRPSPRLVLVLAAASAACTAWLLPGMHERYFYVAEVLAAVWAVVRPRSAPAAVLLCTSAVYTYANYFWSEGRLPTQIFVFFVLAAALWLLRDVWREWRAAQNSET